MRIDCFVSERCASEDALKRNVGEALRLEGIEADVNFYRLTDEEAAERGLRGSPSVFVDGEEVQPVGIEGFSWRLFADESGGLVNVPSVETLRKIIRSKRR